MRSLTVLALTSLLLLGAVPASAQSEAFVCLRVQTATDIDLTDAAAVEDGIFFGDIVVTEVVPCDAATAPMASATPVSDVGTGAWIVGPIEVDPMTDDRRALVSLVAESGTIWYGEPYTLTIACADGSTELRVTWLWDLGPERLIDVDTRIGDGEVTKERWFNDGQSTTYGSADTTFIESLFGETRLAQQVEAPEPGIATAVFDISGIENAVANVRAACGW